MGSRMGGLWELGPEATSFPRAGFGGQDPTQGEPARPAARDGEGHGAQGVARPQPAAPRPQENPYLWNKFADGKLLFRNAALLNLVRSNRDAAVREFWRLLAICHTVMVRESRRECPGRAHPPPHL